MAETTQEKQERIAREVQLRLSDEIPSGDFSLGTVMYDLIVRPMALAFADQEESIEAVRAGMSLPLVLADPTASEESVDALLANYNVTRREGSTAVGNINIYVNSTQNVYIPTNTTFTCGGLTMQPTKAYVAVLGTPPLQDTPDVSYKEMRPFGSGLYVFTVEVVTTTVTDTVLAPGQVCEISVNNSYITRTEIGSVFTGGSLPETNAELLTRAALGINAKVVTGRDNIQALLENQDEVPVYDVGVFGLGDPEQLRDKADTSGVAVGGCTDIYVTTSPVPSATVVTLTGTEISAGMWEIEIPSEDFPGAYGVLNIDYGAARHTEFIPVLGYDMGFDPPGNTPTVREAAHARFSKYQTLKIRFQSDNLPVTGTADFSVTVLHMPGIATLQEYMMGPDIRNYGFDTLVKATIPVLVSVSASVRYPQGITPPEQTTLQQAIADQINLQRMRVPVLEASTVIKAINTAFPEGIVQMPVHVYGRMFLPDGSTVYAHSNNRLTVPEQEGLSAYNSDYFCYPSNVTVHLTEELL